MDLLLRQARLIDGSGAASVPVTWTALVTRTDKPGAALRTVERAGALPGEVYPQIACRPIVMQITMTDPTPLAAIDEWKEVLALPRDSRAALYADAVWRDRARSPTVDAWAARWPKVSVQETVAHGDAVGVPLDQFAVDRRTTPFDLMLDLALADDMTTRFQVVLENDADDEIGTLLADKRTLLGLSDAGAHASQLCDACYSTHLLGHWVRERNAITLEEASHTPPRPPSWPPTRRSIMTPRTPPPYSCHCRGDGLARALACHRP